MSIETKPFPWNYCPACGAALAREHDGEKERPFCAQCKRFYYRNPAPAVCCMLTQDDKLLLVRRGIEPCYGEWSLPGGFVEAGESAQEALVREMDEETCIQVRNPILVGVSTQISMFYGAVMVLGFTASEWSGEPKAGSDATDLKFFAHDERPRLPFPAHIELLESFDARR
jgi:8-oxo-dGTP diphosphatase